MHRRVPTPPWRTLASASKPIPANHRGRGTVSSGKDHGHPAGHGNPASAERRRTQSRPSTLEAFHAQFYHAQSPSDSGLGRLRNRRGRLGPSAGDAGVSQPSRAELHESARLRGRRRGPDPHHRPVPRRFQVSADDDNPTHTGVRFDNLNRQFDDIFATFSPQRLFTPLGTNKMTIRFFVPGTDQRATVKGFGAVFTDVDEKDSTKIELYDRHGKRIWSSNVPKGPKGSRSLSFLGVTTSADICEVRITAGDTPLSAKKKDGWWRDVVAMDDFLYSEPQAVR